MTDRLTLMGTGDALGVPRVYCDCPVCAEARTSGQNRRTRCSALMQGAAGSFWLDCGPDWRAQMESLALRRVEQVLLTHAHHDHIGGLPELYDHVRWTGQEVRVLGPASVLESVAARFPWAARGLGLTPLSPGLTVAGWGVSAWEVNHGRNGRSFAYRFDKPGYSWAYCPDSIDLNAAEQEPLRGLDRLILGTAFYNEDAPREHRSLYSMVEALSLLEVVRPGKTCFTHLSHGVDARVRYTLPEGVQVGHDGLVLSLSIGE
jgi:phosphoribosyl 1,2-cyclic phosphate phosphodiesterase